MKKYLLILLLFSYSIQTFAQSGGWGMDISGGIIHNHSRTARDGSCIQIAHKINNAQSADIFYVHSLEGLKNDWHYWDTRQSYTMNQRVTTIGFFSKYGVRNGANEDGTWKYFALQSLNEPIKYNFKCFCKSNYCESYGTNVELFDEYYGFANVTYYPENIVIAYKGATGNIVPFDEKTTIEAPSGYHQDVYFWEFSGDNGASWQAFPDSLQRKLKLSFSAIDIYGRSLAENRMNQPNAQTWVRMKYESLTGFIYTNTIQLNERYASPRILSVTPASNRCSGEANGKLLLCLDRQLKLGEELEIYYNTEMQLYAYPHRTDTIEIENLSSGAYNIQIAGSYNGKGTYSASPQHKATASIQSPEPVTFEILNQRNVHCYEGQDGAFTVKAQGGVGSYTMYCKTNEPHAEYRVSPFLSPETNVYFSDSLTADTYIVYVTDKNGCFQKELSGNPKTEKIVLSQPPHPVHIKDSVLINPFGFGRKDGSIEIRIEGGTKDVNGFYTIVWWDSTGRDISENAIGNISFDGIFHSLLSAVGSGTYMVEIRDTRYEDAYTSCNSGCMVRDTFTLIEPPKLIASITETHRISCFGGKDGQLTASVAGGIPKESPFPYTYQWEKLTGSTFVKINQSNFAVLSDLPSASYRLIVSDKFQNKDTTELFYLVQPEDLVLTPTHDQIKCNGDNSGKVFVTATGGTTPYQYAWNTGVNTDTISDLYFGRYMVVVTDSAGCFKHTIAEVSSPEQIQMSYTFVSPSCFESKDGSIDLEVSGGLPEYTYVWNTGDTTRNLPGLPAGDYLVEIRDRNSCGFFQEIKLTDPEPLHIDIGKDRTLCNQQALEIKPEVADNQTTFSWRGDNGFHSEAKEVTLTEAGIYTVEITDSKACKAKDTIQVNVDKREISSDFVASTEIFRKDTVILVNISLFDPDSTMWMIEKHSAIEVIQKDKHFAKLVFPENGQFSIGLRSYVGNCYEDTYKLLTVVDPEDFPEWNAFSQALIKQFTIYPNPNSGTFNVKVELEKASAIRLRLIHLGTGEVIHDIKKENEDAYLIPYHLALLTGAYALLLETASGKMIAKLIIN